MNRQLYLNDPVWYDEYVYKIIVALDDKYPNAIPVFGGALGASKHITDVFNLEKFVLCLPEVAESAKFYNWHEGVVGALRRFCHICSIDPMLIEVYLGASFDELFA